MSCYHPLEAYRDRDGGPVSIGFHAGQLGKDRLELPCGRCIGCKLDHSRAWSIRIMHEAQSWDSNLFLTLDYAPEHLPDSLSLEYPHFQAFMRRLRKELRGVSPITTTRRRRGRKRKDGTYGPSRTSTRTEYPIRFFVAGEYGEQFGRPHWHAILFNVDFADKVRYVNGTYRSSVAEDLWERGNVVIGTLTPRSAAYVAGYTLSKVYGSAAADHYEDVVDLRTGELTRRRPEFCTMSRRPGIGSYWYEKFGSDLFPHDFAVMHGSKHKVPLYYWRRFQETGDPSLVEDISQARFLRAMEVDRVENSERRRTDKEQVAWARVRMFSERKH